MEIEFQCVKHSHRVQELPRPSWKQLLTWLSVRDRVSTGIDLVRLVAPKLTSTQAHANGLTSTATSLASSLHRMKSSLCALKPWTFLIGQIIARGFLVARSKTRLTRQTSIMAAWTSLATIFSSWMGAKTHGNTQVCGNYVTQTRPRRPWRLITSSVTRVHTAVTLLHHGKDSHRFRQMHRTQSLRKSLSGLVRRRLSGLPHWRMSKSCSEYISSITNRVI